MEVKEFNELKKLVKSDKDAANDLLQYCLSIIKRRVLFRNGINDVENISHSILEKFVTYLPAYEITAPVKYLRRCVDNYLSTHKRKVNREVPLDMDISYEQNFEELEKLELYNKLVKHLGRTNAILVFGYVIERVAINQLAEELNIKYDNARKRVSRALKKLGIIYNERHEL